jgi:glycosyltransferase involved in cell wall biosynthesis
VEHYGGTERVCYFLAKAQAELGHEVTVLCRPGSKLPFAQTVAIPERIEDLDSFLPKGIDVVQLYNTPNFKSEVPYLVNIGGNGQSGEEFSPCTVFVSRNHAQRHGWTEYVHNGIDPSEYPLRKQKKKQLLFLAKASWKVKNLKGAIRIARAGDWPLHVAGGKASCWHRGVYSHGMIGGAEKLQLLQESAGLLFPVIWEEPFGLAVIEALACGTPVVATPRGGIPEIIDSKSGVMSDSFSGLVRALTKLPDFEPEQVRSRVFEGFTHIQMAENYHSKYQIVISKGRLREGVPRTPVGRDPQELVRYRKD